MKKIKKFQFKCDCGNVITEEDVESYPHTGGVDLERPYKEWLYFHCLKCSYDWAWWKIEKKLGFKLVE
jgi:hypothetical protein